MSVKLRFKRLGNTNRPFFRLVAIDSRSRRDGRALEELGFYDPLQKPAAVQLQEGAILQWLGRGAEPSDTVRELLRTHGILQKWELMRGGVSVEEATQRVGERLAVRAVKTKKARLSKKARAKAAETKKTPTTEEAASGAADAQAD